MEKEKLQEILRLHKMWFNGEVGGERANLRDANLRDADLSGEDLSYADLSDADLSGANLRYADLSRADLSGADLSDANLHRADLYGADLSYANLRGADLSYANLSDANLRGADLRGAYLSNIKTDYLTIGINIECPEEGSFIAYKKSEGHLIKLLILEDAKRNSATTKKCRCNKAKILEIINIETGKAIDKIESEYYSSFIYEVGKTVEVKNFEENRWDECPSGIHFFMNKQNALDWEN